MDCCWLDRDLFDPTMASPRVPENVVAHYSERCLVAPSPEVREQLLHRYNQIQQLLSESPENALLQSVLRPVEKRRKGFNDGVVRPPSTFRPGVTLAEQLADRAPLRGAVRVIVVLVDFADKKFTATQTKEHFNKLWFEEKSNSVRDYYHDVSNGAVTIQVSTPRCPPGFKVAVAMFTSINNCLNNCNGLDRSTVGSDSSFVSFLFFSQFCFKVVVELVSLQLLLPVSIRPLLRRCPGFFPLTELNYVG